MIVQMGAFCEMSRVSGRTLHVSTLYLPSIKQKFRAGKLALIIRPTITRTIMLRLFYLIHYSARKSSGSGTGVVKAGRRAKIVLNRYE